MMRLMRGRGFEVGLGGEEVGVLEAEEDERGSLEEEEEFVDERELDVERRLREKERTRATHGGVGRWKVDREEEGGELELEEELEKSIVRRVIWEGIEMVLEGEGEEKAEERIEGFEINVVGGGGEGREHDLYEERKRRTFDRARATSLALSSGFPSPFLLLFFGSKDLPPDAYQSQMKIYESVKIFDRSPGRARTDAFAR